MIMCNLISTYIKVKLYLVLCFILQAMYRGHWVRRRLREVMEGARCVSEEEDSFDEDINLDSMDEVRTICVL